MYSKCNHASWAKFKMEEVEDLIVRYNIENSPNYTMNLWRTIGAKIQLLILLVLLAFDIVVLQFVLTSAIQHSSFQFLYTPIDDLTLFVSQFNIQVYAIQHPSLRTIQHPSLRNSTFNFGKYPTAIQSMTVSVGSENYQNFPCVGASKGRSHYPRQ